MLNQNVQRTQDCPVIPHHYSCYFLSYNIDMEAGLQVLVVTLLVCALISAIIARRSYLNGCRRVANRPHQTVDHATIVRLGL